MMTRKTTHPRHAVTLIELTVVMSIIMILSAIGIPSVTTIIRRGAVSQSADAVAQMWREARSRALRGSMPTDERCYGVVLRTPAEGPITVDLVRGLGAADDEVLIRRIFPTGVGLQLTGIGGSELRWFAQYGSGVPISAAAVASRTSATASARSVGVTHAAWLPSLCDEILVHGRGYDSGGSAPGTHIRRIAIDLCGQVRVEEVR